MKHELMKYLIPITIIATLILQLYCGWLIIAEIEFQKGSPNLFSFLLGIVFYEIAQNVAKTLRAFLKDYF
jgi:hypothetical protein